VVSCFTLHQTFIFWHTNILKWASIRSAWSTEDEMNKGLIKAWNSVVKPEDTVYNLGDLAFKAGSKTAEINAILWALNGRHVLIKGNHDDRKKIALFTSIVEFHDELILEIQGVRFLLKHYPYEHAMKESDKTERPDSFTNARYDEKTGKLFPLIHGHVHDHFAMKKHCLNVGFDAWGRLLSEDDVISIYNDTNGFTENFEKYNEMNRANLFKPKGPNEISPSI